MAEQQQDQGWTEKALPSVANQPQEPEPSQDVTWRLVLVEWEDSVLLTDDGWMHLDGTWNTAPRVIYSAGWLVYDGEGSKIIVSHANRASPEHYAQGTGVISIPSRAVVRIVDLVDAPQTQTTEEA